MLGALAMAITLSGFWHLYIPWLIFLGILVPPLGTVILAEAVISRQRGEEPLPAWRWSAFAAWAAGALAGYANYHWAPEFPTPITALLATLLCYFLLRSTLRQPRRFQRHGSDTSTDSAIAMPSSTPLPSPRNGEVEAAAKQP